MFFKYASQLQLTEGNIYYYLLLLAFTALAIITLLLFNIVMKSLAQNSLLKKNQFKGYDCCNFSKDKFITYMTKNPIFLRSEKRSSLDRLIDLLLVRWNFFYNINKLNTKNALKCFITLANIIVLLTLLNLITTETQETIKNMVTMFTKSWVYIFGASVAMFWHLDAVFSEEVETCS